MPEPGVVDQDYLDRVMEGVDLLGDRGMWVLMDFHQDVFDGMPSWATTPATAALPVFPAEQAQGAAWALQYLSPRSLGQWVTGGTRSRWRMTAAPWTGTATAWSRWPDGSRTGRT